MMYTSLHVARRARRSTGLPVTIGEASEAGDILHDMRIPVEVDDLRYRRGENGGRGKGPNLDGACRRGRHCDDGGDAHRGDVGGTRDCSAVRSAYAVVEGLDLVLLSRCFFHRGPGLLGEEGLLHVSVRLASGKE